jgi:hypothetical protein
MDPIYYVDDSLSRRAVGERGLILTESHVGDRDPSLRLGDDSRQKGDILVCYDYLGTTIHTGMIAMEKLSLP